MPKAAELALLELAHATAWRAWLAHNGTTSRGVMLATTKKKLQSPKTTITAEQALDEALCYGWIDSGGKKVDDATYLYRFGPRKPKGLWSKRNVGYIERLEREGKMTDAGRACVEAAKADGRWAKAYSAAGADEMPKEFMDEMKKSGNENAKEIFEGLSRGSRWVIYFRLINLKTDKGRTKAIADIVAMLNRGEAPVTQKKRKSEAEEEGTRNALKQKRVKVAEDEDEMEGSTKATTSASEARRTRSGRVAPSYAE